MSDSVSPSPPADYHGGTEGGIMTGVRMVVPAGDGTWRVLEPGCKRASAVEETREDAEQRARKILRNLGGGELRVCAVDGSVVAVQRILPPEPRSARDTKIYRAPRGSYGIG